MYLCVKVIYFVSFPTIFFQIGLELFRLYRIFCFSLYLSSSIMSLINTTTYPCSGPLLSIPLKISASRVLICVILQCKFIQTPLYNPNIRYTYKKCAEQYNKEITILYWKSACVLLNGTKKKGCTYSPEIFYFP